MTKLTNDQVIALMSKAVAELAHGLEHVRKRPLTSFSEKQCATLAKLANDVMDARVGLYRTAQAIRDTLTPPLGGRIVTALSPKEIERRRRRANIPPTSVQAKRERERSNLT
jgi:hypothetical protein